MEDPKFSGDIHSQYQEELDPTDPATNKSGLHSCKGEEKNVTSQVEWSEQFPVRLQQQRENKRVQALPHFENRDHHT